MDNELVSLLKKETGYRNKQPTCASCIHSGEVECEYLDRSWNHVCNFHSIGAISIELTGCCDRHTPKETLQDVLRDALQEVDANKAPLNQETK